MIIITGLSGSGKSTMGPELAKYLGDQKAYLDEDPSFKQDKPKVKYQGRDVNLWDAEEAIDFDDLSTRTLLKVANHQRVVLTGFYFPPSFLQTLPVEKIIVLDISPEISIARRQKSKSLSSPAKGFDLDKDRWMVENYTYPFFKKGLENLENSFHGLVYHIDATQEPFVVWKELLGLI